MKSDIIGNIKSAVTLQNLRKLGNKTKTGRKGTMVIDKLDDANRAGSKLFSSTIFMI